MRIDSSGRLLVGTTTASGYTDRLLTVGDASTSSITAEIRSSSQGQISFSDGVAQNASSYRGLVGYNHGSDYMYLYTNSAERLRIDNSGKMSLGSKSRSNLVICTLLYGTSTLSLASGQIVLEVLLSIMADTIVWIFLCRSEIVYQCTRRYADP